MKRILKTLVVALVMGTVTLSAGCGNKATPAPEKSKTYQKMQRDANTAKKDVKKGTGTVKKDVRKSTKTIKKDVTTSPSKGSMNKTK
jgi:hypothetical protein